MTQTRIHESFDQEKANPASDRSFGLVFAVAFALIGFWPMTAGRGAHVWALVLAIAFLAAALANPRVLHPLNRLWFRLGQLLHHVVTPIVMGLIFFFGILPTALIMRTRRRDPLRIDARKPGETNWIIRTPPGPAPDSMKHLF
jgi:hypothetical protein